MGFLDRLKEEQKELEIKLKGLTKFLNTEAFYKTSHINQVAMYKQRDAMDDYNFILQVRISNSERE